LELRLALEGELEFLINNYNNYLNSNGQAGADREVTK
jgi:hypothetical protein